MDELNVNFNLSENEELNANFQLQNEDLSVNFSLNDNEEIKAGFSLSENNLGANFALNEEESIEATFKVNLSPSKVSELINDKNYVTERELLSAVDNKQDKGDYIDNIESRGNVSISRNGGTVYLSTSPGVSHDEFYRALEAGLDTRQPLGDYLETLGNFSSWDELNAYGFKNQAFYSFNLSGEFAAIGYGVYICYCDFFQLSSGTFIYKFLKGFNLSTSKSVTIDMLNRTIKEVETDYATKNYVDETIELTKDLINEKQDKGDYALKEELNDYVLKTAMNTQLNDKADISFHNVTTTGRSYVASWLAPSDKYINYTWSAGNYLEYVAPSHGYFWASMRGSSANSYVEWRHVNNEVYGLQCRSYGADPQAYIYVKKGQTVRLFWSGMTFFYYIRFFYCLGSEWEAEE